MVWLHVVDDKVVDRTIADHFLDVFNVLGKEIYLYRVNQANFLIYNEIRVVGYTVWQWPQTLEQGFVAVVDTDVINVVCNFNHNVI
jgi:hypothetical protein